MSSLTSLENHIRANQFLKCYPQFDKDIAHKKIFGNPKEVNRSTYKDTYNRASAFPSINQYEVIAERIASSYSNDGKISFPPIRNSFGEVNFTDLPGRRNVSNFTRSDGNMRTTQNNCPRPCKVTDFGCEHYRSDISKDNLFSKQPIETEGFYDTRRRVMEISNPGHPWQTTNMSNGKPKRYTDFNIY